MSILVNENTRVVVQGITGREGIFHALQMREYGTKVVAGVTPGKGGQQLEGFPILNSVREAVEQFSANTSIIFVPARFAAEAIIEASAAGIELVVCITEGIPTLDMIRAKLFCTLHQTTVIGPNCPGLISPGKAKVGIMPGFIHTPGPVGVISRSGTLTYEVVDQLSRLGLGQSTCVGIGGDPVAGSDFVSILKHFAKDPETKAIILVGEIGGNAEELAAQYASKLRTPIIAFIAGQTAPPGRRMGHAGAIISGGKGTAADKIRALNAAGIKVALSPAEVGSLAATYF